MYWNYDEHTQIHTHTQQVACLQLCRWDTPIAAYFQGLFEFSTKSYFIAGVQKSAFKANRKHYLLKQPLKTAVRRAGDWSHCRLVIKAKLFLQQFDAGEIMCIISIPVTYSSRRLIGDVSCHLSPCVIIHYAVISLRAPALFVCEPKWIHLVAWIFLWIAWYRRIKQKVSSLSLQKPG